MVMEQGMEQHTSNAVASNCLTVADKRPHRPGGCVGIFFQLFDWNRRLAKKKLFSTKLLPPARMKQASKKFAGDETMPKTKPLIADENSGGFPANAKKNSSNRSLAEFQKQEMRSPSLVARLMGLDSMPAVQRDKHKKPSKSDPLADLSSDKVSTKPESRPPKLQKTGQCDQRAVVTPRLGAEALHIRSVLSRSRKHGNPPAKLATPVKSPKLSSSGRHASRTSRLIDAATRILEPGIQATNRAKSTIAYSNSKRYAPNDEALGGIFGQSVKEVQKSSSVTSCKNCGNVVDVVLQSRMEEEPFHYRATSLASHFATPYTDQGRDVACKRKQGQQISSDVEMQDKGRACSSEVVADRKDMLHEFGAKGQSKGFQHGYSHRTDDETSAAVGFKQRSQGQNRMPVVGSDRLTQASKLSSFSGTKDFVAMNRSLSGRSRVRVLNRMDNPTFNMERRFCNRRDDVLPQLRSPGVKRKTVSARAQLQSNGHGTSIPPVRQRSINFDAVNEKKIGLNPFRARTRFDSQSESSIPNKGNIDLASFTFSSQSRVRTGYDSRNPMGQNSSNRRNMVGESEGKGCVQKQVSPRRDALGSLLQQKLKELISQEEDELKGGNALPIRSTAMILQELISALTIETVIPTSPPSSFSIANALFQNGKHYLSPGSVLDASFSNESCFSSSLDDNSASSMLTWDSTTTSTTEGRRFLKLVTDLHDHISRILQSITLAGGCQLTSRDLRHAKETILTAELLFGAATHHGPDRTRSSVLGSFLLDELSAVAVSMGSKEASNQLRRLLFDCVMEWLDSRCSRYCDTGFRTWRQQQLLVPWCKETVMEEVGEEVKRWTNMAGLIPDEMVELEMGPSLAKWTEFEVESYEIGGDIGCEIVDVLLEETMRDLWEL